MENLRTQNKSSHGVDKIFNIVLVALLLCQAVVAEVEELDRFAPFDQVHHTDDLFGEQRVPRKAQAFDHLVRLEEHAQILEQL